METTIHRDLSVLLSFLQMTFLSVREYHNLILGIFHLFFIVTLCMPSMPKIDKKYQLFHYVINIVFNNESVPGGTNITPGKHPKADCT